MKGRKGNIGKVKYFLPGAREATKSKGESKVFNRSLPPKNSLNCVAETQKEEDDISFEILAINQNIHSDSNKENKRTLAGNKVNITKALKDYDLNVPSKSDFKIKGLTPFGISQWDKVTNDIKMPQGKEKQEFLSFIQQLKNDVSYQNTVTMFTIMYYYQKKK